MHGLETIKAINADPAAYHRANEAAAVEHARTQPTRDKAAAQQRAHGDRVRARQVQNGPYVNPQGPETPPAARTTFGDFWIKLNAERGTDVPYDEARKAFAAKDRTLADRTEDQRAAGFTPGTGIVTRLPDVQELYHSAIDQKPGSPFMEFWLELNEQRGTEVRYGEARALFNGGPTPANALTFVEKGDGIRAIPAPPVNGMDAWYAEFREITGKGTKWHRVNNQASNPIVYTTPGFALNAAVWAKGNAIEKAFH